MQSSDFSQSSDSSGSREARASMGRLLSYWQYYRRKIHLLWRALDICDHRGFTFHPSSNHHHYHHIIITTSLLSSNHYHLPITSSSQHHYYHQIIIILPSHHHPQLVKITSLITSAGNITSAGRFSSHGERKRCSTMKQSRSAIHFTLT